MSGGDRPRFRLEAHRAGPWLLTLAGRRFGVAPDLGRRLAGCGGSLDPEAVRGLLTPEEAAALRDLAAGGGAAGRPARDAGIRPRLPLLPAVAVDAAARRLAPLASWPALAALAAGGGLACLLGPLARAGAPAAAPAGGAPGAAVAPAVGTWGPALALFLAGALWHELGHAAALRREGYPAGRIGGGLLLLVPVLWCDVSAVGLLPRRGRLRVDLAGAGFQLAAAGLLGLLPAAAARLAAWSTLLAVAWSLLPVLRTDGHWLLADLLGLPDLEAPAARATAGRVRARRAVAGTLLLHRLLRLLLLAGAVLWLPGRVADAAVAAAAAMGLGGGDAAVPPVLRVVLSAALLAATVPRLRRLLAAGALDLRLLLSGRPGTATGDPAPDAAR